MMPQNTHESAGVEVMALLCLTSGQTDRDEVSQVNGRAVLVTGASRGIGAAVAHAFAGQGDRVAVHYANSAGPAADVLAALPGEGHLMIQADLADPDAVRSLVDKAARALGGLDVLVNNAGVYAAQPVTEGTYEEWQAAWQHTPTVNPPGAAHANWGAGR